MNVTRSAYVLLSGCVVYGVMAACSSDGGSPAGGPQGKPDGSSILDPVDTAHAEPGSRLRPNYLRGDDGSKQFLGWFDTKLETECTFMTVGSGGGMWCMPSADINPDMRESPRERKILFFDDPAACTDRPNPSIKPLMLLFPKAQTCGSATRSKYYARPDGSCGGLEYLTYGDEVAKDARIMYRIDGVESCQPMTPDRKVYVPGHGSIDLEGVIFFRNGAKVSTDAFVKGTKGP